MSDLRPRVSTEMADTPTQGATRSAELPFQLGRYQVLRELGRGGMARVYEARHTALGLPVALKIMNPPAGTGTNAAERFIREARTLSRIRHQNVVQVFDVGVEQLHAFIAMELLDGLDLAKTLMLRGALAPEHVADVFLPVISAVSTAHAAGIIHRDLKPANIMLVSRPPREIHPVVLDFGISKCANLDLAKAPLTHSEALLGTVPYLAPELSKGVRSASTQSDLYALGVMLYECATGIRPFSGESQYEVMHAILTQRVVPPSVVRPGVPGKLDEIILRAMRREPEQRYPTVHALGSDLLNFASKRTRTVWQDEFLSSGSTGRDPWTVQEHTLEEMPPIRPGQPVHRVSKGYSRWGVFALMAYALLMTLALARLALRPDAPTKQDGTSGVPAQPPVFAGPTGHPRVSDVPPLLPSAGDSRDAQPRAPAGGARRVVGGSVSAYQEGEPAYPPRKPPARSDPQLVVDRGTNGAIIVE